MRLEVFEGPFDLLLQLIARRKLDVSEVDLADITSDFLAHLADATAPAEPGGAPLDLDTVTHFLVVAATLIELKAVRLLPAEQREELEDLLAEARDVLYARLLEYRAFREASARLRDLLAANDGHHGRDVPLEPHLQRLVPEVQLDVDAAGLALLAAAALAPRPQPTVSVAHLHAALLTVRDAAHRLLARLDAPGARATFRTLVAGLPLPERIVHFLATLELYKLGHLDLHQPERFGEVFLERRAGGADLAGLDDEQGPAGHPTGPSGRPDRDPDRT